MNAPQTRSVTTLNVSPTFGDSSIEAKLVQIDIGLFRSQLSLFRLNYVYSITNWHFDNAPVTQLNEVCSKYPHLQHINFSQLVNNKIQALLGIDATLYILKREFLQGLKNTPFAILTFSTEDDEDPLTKSLTSFWKIDTSGTENEDELSLSKNDKRAVERLNKTVRRTGQRYEIVLLWREKVALENNYFIAKAQVHSLDKKLQNDKTLKNM